MSRGTRIRTEADGRGAGRVSGFDPGADRCTSSPDRRIQRLCATAATLLAAPVALACADHVSRADLLQRIQVGSAPPILDVRTRGEYEAAHVPEAVHVPFYSIFFRRDEIPEREGEPLVVYCAHGPRAGIARAQLFAAGVGPVVYLEGHMTAWTRDGLPTRSGPGEQQAGPAQPPM